MDYTDSQLIRDLRDMLIGDDFMVDQDYFVDKPVVYTIIHKIQFLIIYIIVSAVVLLIRLIIIS